MPRFISIQKFRVVVLALGAISAAGCRRSGNGPQHSDQRAYSWNAPFAAGSTLRIKNMNGAIDVGPSHDGNASVTAETKWRRGNPMRDITFKQFKDGDNVTICALWGSGSSCDATNYTVKNGGGMSRLFGNGNANDIEVNFTVFVPAGVKVELQTINGSVTATSTGPVHARSVNGAIKVGTAVGPVDAETVSGNVDVRMTTLGGEGDVRAKTMNGTASAFLPQKLDANVTVKTMNGEVGSDFSLTTDPGRSIGHQLTGTVGAGGRTVEVASMNGNAWIRKLNADGTVAAEAASAPAASGGGSGASPKKAAKP